MAAKQVNVGKLYAIIDQRRVALDMTWRDVARETQLSPATFSRMALNKSPDADAVATLCWWAALDLREYI